MAMSSERSIFSHSVADLERWSAREKISAKKLNAPLDAIDSMMRGVPPPFQTPSQNVVGGGGGGGATPVSVIRGVIGEADKIVVQPLKWSDDSLVNDGETKTVNVWPDRTYSDYAAFVGKPDILPMFDLGGKLCIMHHIRFTQVEPPAGTVFGGCP